MKKSSPQEHEILEINTFSGEKIGIGILIKYYLGIPLLGINEGYVLRVNFLRKVSSWESNSLLTVKSLTNHSEQELYPFLSRKKRKQYTCPPSILSYFRFWLTLEMVKTNPS